MTAGAGPAGSIDAADTESSLLERALTFDGRHGDLAFTFVLWLFIGTLIAASFTLDRKDRQVPLVVAVPTFILLSVTLSMLLSERISDFADRIADTEVFGATESELPIADEDEGDEMGTLLEWRTNNLIAFATVFGLFVLIYVLGFYVAIPIFLLGVYRLKAHQSWPVTLAATVLLWSFVIGVFHIVLSVRLYSGVLELEITQYLPF